MTVNCMATATQQESLCFVRASYWRWTPSELNDTGQLKTDTSARAPSCPGQRRTCGRPLSASCNGIKKDWSRARTDSGLSASWFGIITSRITNWPGRQLLVLFVLLFGVVVSDGDWSFGLGEAKI